MKTKRKTVPRSSQVRAAIDKEVPAAAADLKDDLRPHYDIDYSKAKPNRFAKRPKIYHGGARPGAGRKAAPEPVERHTLVIYKSHADYLRSLDPSLSKALRKLIAAGKS
jgi:hypothetical protein